MNTNNNEVNLVLRTTLPVSWSVEAINTDEDDTIEIAIFSGPSSEKRAREYMAWRYGITQAKVIAV